MSGPHETRDSAAETGAPPAPASAAPPSFGNADPGDDEPATDSPVTDSPVTDSSVADAPAGSAPAEDESETPSAQASPERSEKTSEEGPAGKPGTIGLPPFLIQRPWWAADEDESDQQARSGAEDEPKADATEPSEPGSDPAGTAPNPAPGTLVAGVGVPSVDTRGAVPAEPIASPSTPPAADTASDGIPRIRLDDMPADGKPEGDAAAADRAADDGTADDGTADAGATGGRATGEKPADTGKTDDAPSAAEPDRPSDAAPTGAPGRPEESDRTAANDATVQTPPPALASASGDGPAGDDTAPLPRTEAPIPDTPAPGHEMSSDAPTVVTPALPAQGGPSFDGSTQTLPVAHVPAGASPSGDGKGGRRKALLAVGGVAGAAIVAAGVFALAGGTSDDGRKAASTARTPAAAQPPSTPPPSRPATPTTPALPPQASINNVKTDPKPLALIEVFPSKTITLGGRVYVQDKASVNHQCTLTARGAMAKALQRGGCTSVVRVTFLDRKRSIAVTSGVAVLPNRNIALKVSRAGDPSRYEWFRGMAGSRSRDIDRAGGYAASTVRGRYIIYAYAQYANGKRPQPGDMLQQVAHQFIDYAVRPIDARAKRRP
ncbi:hypothetical protein Arub01_38860 [Actinomadura rubrobrunea]|uniref:Uncharacterized protein n=1 Tax=Actinomadura rubrobrunea TaxID=115335 RepID=A0A9W6UXV8_9ACTN|nr:hypothetical protein [Actinomadura rubrobrunea]GLW65642.1 hypothetical protein Arub01_38860 [Actinomadura rubrobrunea]